MSRIWDTLRRGQVETDNTYMTDPGNTEKEMTEIIAELKKLDSEQLMSVLNIVRDMRFDSQSGRNAGRYS
jgi:hypothetical protein